MELEIEQFYKYSQDKSQLLIAHSDNKARVYDVQTQKAQQFVLEQKIVNSQITCADIFVNEHAAVLCAFGNTKGDLMLYDLNRSEKLFQLNLHQKQVIDLSFSQKGDYIYTISADKYLKKIDLKLKQEVFSKEVKKRGFIEKSRILSLNANQIVYSVENKLTLLDIEQDKEIQKYTGHSQNISLLRKSQNGQQFISFSGEGFINIFNSQQNTPLYTVNVLNQSKIINLEILFQNKQKSQVLIHHIDQVVLVDIVFGQQKPTSSNKILNLKSPVLHVSYDNQKQLQVGYGSSVDLKLKQIHLIQNKKQLNQNDIQSQLDDLLQNKVKIAQNQNKIQQQDQKNTYVVGEADFDKERELPLRGEEDLEQQLEKVGILENLKKYAENEDDVTNVKSLAVVLLQGLHNNDQHLLDFCLEKDEDELIENTVRKLLPSKVGKLIENVTDRLNRFPYKASILCKWLKNIIKYHNSILISTPQIHQKLGSLLSMIEGRTKNLNKMIALRGKIDMILTLKRERQIKQQKLLQEQEENQKPLVIYQEGDGDLYEEDEQIEEDQVKDNISDSITESEDDEEEDEDDIDNEFDQATKQARQDNIDGLEEEDIEEDSDYMEF